MYVSQQFFKGRTHVNIRISVTSEVFAGKSRDFFPQI